MIYLLLNEVSTISIKNTESIECNLYIGILLEVVGLKSCLFYSGEVSLFCQHSVVLCLKANVEKNCMCVGKIDTVKNNEN